MTKREEAKLGGIPETLLIPLRARYLESKKPDGIVSDPKTIEILDRIEYDFSGKKEVSKGSQLGVAIRTEILDEQTNNFLKKNPGATVVNLGCGLDTRFHRIDDGSVNWYDLDVPEAIELRRKFFDETDRFRFIAKSVLDPTWTELVPKDKPILFIAEGLLMYFTEDEVKEILSIICSAFPKSEMLLEAMSPFMARSTKRHPDVKHYNVEFKWGVKSGADLEKWGIGVRFIKEWYYFDRHRDKFPLPFRVLSVIPAFRKGMKIVHIDFAGGRT
jgi:O-methyltransferase involved in polyketide biosynthesis